MTEETVLNVFPCDDPNQRLVVAIEREGFGQTQLVLRQETRADHVGWFVQSRITVQPEQVAGLRMALGQAKAIEPAPRCDEDAPAVIRFCDAVGQVG